MDPEVMTWMRNLMALALAIALGLLTTVKPASAVTAPTRDWTPISGSIGWRSCAPISWSIDPGALSPRTVNRQITALAWAFEQWSDASGLEFAYAGTIPTHYVPSSAELEPADGRSRPRHIYLTWLTPVGVPELSGRTSGFAAPSQVSAGTINGGRAVFKAGYVEAVTKRAPQKVRALYLHEIGHILGLGHAETQVNRMYPIVDEATSLGPGDVAGVRTLTRGC